MTVYVDNMHVHPMGRFRRMKMSHMIADTETELHAMAALLCIARKWYQGDHYDISLSKRSLAVSLGAIEITLRQAGLMTMQRRVTGALPTPEEAEARHREAIEAGREIANG